MTDSNNAKQKQQLGKKRISSSSSLSSSNKRMDTNNNTNSFGRRSRHCCKSYLFVTIVVVALYYGGECVVNSTSPTVGSTYTIIDSDQSVSNIEINDYQTNPDVQPATTDTTTTQQGTDLKDTTVQHQKDAPWVISTMKRLYDIVDNNDASTSIDTTDKVQVQKKQEDDDDLLSILQQHTPIQFEHLYNSNNQSIGQVFDIKWTHDELRQIDEYNNNYNSHRRIKETEYEYNTTITNNSTTRGRREQQLRIIGGYEVTSDQYKKFAFYKCGGTLIRGDLILTAAHCQSIFAETKTIYLRPTTVNPDGVPPVTFEKNNNDGTDTTTNIRNGIALPIRSMIVHPKWTWTTQQNDIMILKLRCKISLQSIGGGGYQKINRNMSLPEVGSKVTTIGFGSTSEGGSYNTDLLATTVNVVNGQSCFEQYGNDWINDTTMICAGLDNGGQDACSGDSGGPLFVNTNNNNNDSLQIGIVSFGWGCGRIGYPGVYTRVSAFYPWIVRIITHFSKIKHMKQCV